MGNQRHWTEEKRYRRKIETIKFPTNLGEHMDYAFRIEEEKFPCRQDLIIKREDVVDQLKNIQNGKA